MADFKTLVLPLTLTLLGFFSFGQNITYNYANLNTTMITANSFNQIQAHEFVDDPLTWTVGRHDPKWVKFGFHEKIKVDSIKLFFHKNLNTENGALQFELILADTTISIPVQTIQHTVKVNQITDQLIINRKIGYPQGYGSLIKIMTLSDTEPQNKTSGSPIVNTRKAERLKVKHEIMELSDTEIKQHKKIWRKRKRFYNQHLKFLLGKSEKDRFKKIFMIHDDSYCFRLRDNISKLSNQEVKYFFNDCHCDVRSEFFERGMPATPEMNQRTFTLSGKQLSYEADTTEEVLLEILDGGSASAGFAVVHLGLMNQHQHTERIENLKTDGNVFAQVQALKGLVYLKEHKRALEVAKHIYKTEMKSLQQDSISLYGKYSVRGLKVMNEYYPAEVLPLLLNLYKTYASFYPPLNAGVEKYSPPSERKKLVSKRRQNMEGSHRFILTYIDDHLVRYPHLATNETMKEFIQFIKIRDTPIPYKDDGLFCY